MAPSSKRPVSNGTGTPSSYRQSPLHIHPKMNPGRWQQLLLSLCLVCVVGWAIMMVNAAAFQRGEPLPVVLQVGGGNLLSSGSLPPAALAGSSNEPEPAEPGESLATKLEGNFVTLEAAASAVGNQPQAAAEAGGGEPLLEGSSQCSDPGGGWRASCEATEIVVKAEVRDSSAV